MQSIRRKPFLCILNVSKTSFFKMYHAIEEYLMSQCHDRPSPDDEESCDAVNTDLLPPYKTSKDATLRMSNSISMLNRLVIVHVEIRYKSIRHKCKQAWLYNLKILRFCTCECK